VVLRGNLAQRRDWVLTQLVVFVCGFRYLPPECFAMGKAPPRISSKVYSSPLCCVGSAASGIGCKRDRLQGGSAARGIGCKWDRLQVGSAASGIGRKWERPQVGSAACGIGASGIGRKSDRPTLRAGRCVVCRRDPLPDVVRQEAVRRGPPVATRPAAVSAAWVLRVLSGQA
jgi:hypothetical protein